MCYHPYYSHTQSESLQHFKLQSMYKSILGLYTVLYYILYDSLPISEFTIPRDPL